MNFANNFPAVLGILGIIVIIMLVLRDKKTPPPPARRVSTYGNSAEKGGFFDMTTTPPTLRQYSPDPAALIGMASGGSLVCTNRAENGLQVHEQLQGGPVAMGAGTGLGETTRVRHLAEMLAEDDAELVMLHFGEVEAMFTDMDVNSFCQSMRAAVRRVQETGKLVAISGLIRFQITTTVTADMSARRDAFNIALCVEAQSLGVPFIDVYRAGEPTACGDLIHPTGEYHERIARARAPQIMAVFG